MRILYAFLNVRFKQRYSILFIFVTLAVETSELCHAQDSGAFAKLDFGGNTYIEVPRNWTYPDENLRKHLNTGGEAVARLAGITPNPVESRRSTNHRQTTTHKKSDPQKSDHFFSARRV